MTKTLNVTENDVLDGLVSLSVGSGIGPWDNHIVESDYRPRHSLDTTVVLSAVNLDVPHQSRVLLKPAYGELNTVLVELANTTSRVAVTINASPTSGEWWETDALPKLFAQQRRNLDLVKQQYPDAPDSTICEVTGPFGTEIHTWHASSASPERDVRESVTLGCSGPKWTIKVTVWGEGGINVPDDDLTKAYQILSSMIIYRPAGALFPGTPLPLGIVR